MATCALCREESTLRRSHVIPKFTQKRIKAFDGRLLHFSGDSHPDGDVRQDAFFEDLMCDRCEARVQKWEDHAARMIYQKRVFDFPPTKDRELKTISGFDYLKMKLFLISVLWRMGVSRLDAFSKVELGPRLDRMRSMMLAGDPGDVTDYGATVIVVQIEGERIPLSRPGDGIMYKTQSLRMYRALIDGLLIAWIVGSRSHMRRFVAAPLVLQANGTWTTHSRDWRSLAFIRSEIDRLLERSE